MRTRRMRLIAVVTAGAFLAGACSDGGGGEEAAEDPKAALTEALDAFADYEGVTLEMTIEADADALVENDAPPEVADALVNSSLVVSAKGSTPEDSSGEFRLNIDGNEDAVELRVVGTSFYLRADVAELVEKFGGDTAEVDAAVQQFSAMGFDFAQDVVDGQWVGVENVDAIAEQFGVPIPTPDPDAAAALQEKLAEVLERNADVTSEGTDDVGAHLVVTLPLKETVTELFDTLQSLGGAAAGAPLPADALDDVPAADIPLDVWIEDGRLVQVEADVIAIGEALGEEPPEDLGEFAFRMTIDEFTEDVEAPDDFTSIDVQELLQGAFGGALGATGTDVTTGEAGGTDQREVVVPELGLACSDLAGVPPDQIKTFLEASGQPGAFKTIKRACPELF